MCITAHYEHFVARLFIVAMISGIVIIIIYVQSNSFDIFKFNLNKYNNFKSEEVHLALL